MLKRLLLTLGILIGLAGPAMAQLGPVPFSFSPGTTIKSSEVNANFSQAYSTSCLRSACVLTGTATTRSILPGTDATYDIGASGTAFRDAWFSRNAAIGGTLGATGATTLSSTLEVTGMVTGHSGLSGAAFYSPTADNTTSGVQALRAGYNNNGSTPAAGYVDLMGKSGVHNYVWVDVSGNMRVDAGTAPSSGSGDVIGTVVGTQTSTRDTKMVDGLTGVSRRSALNAILSAKVYDFTYRSGAYSGTRFHGLMIDDSPWIGMDPSPDHPSGRSFNPETALGYTVLALQAQQEEIRQLREELARLKKEKH